MNLRRSDYLLVTLSRRLAPLLKEFGDLESDIMRRRLSALPIDRPVFITGLARSGTTLLLNLLARVPGVATHRYRDFPFLWTPLVWNWVQAWAATAPAPVERPHRDRIHITKESPEAFEEPLWQFFFPTAHAETASHCLEDSVEAPTFEAFLLDHLRKVVLLRGGARYVSKGNYNVGRIAYLARLFPDAKFVVPVREPLGHVHSLVKQHRLFSNYAAQDARVPVYLEAAGHYEFGPQRRPINLSKARAGRVIEAWRRGDDYRGYAAMWAEVYDHVWTLRDRRPELGERLHFVRYDALCRAPRAELARILEFTDLSRAGAPILDDLAHIRASAATEEAALADEVRAAVWSEVADVAERFGWARATS